MNISAEEKLMYQVMKAIYDSGIPISFKGSMVLKACLMEAGYEEDVRHTVDIDANWNSDTFPTGEQMAESLQTAIRKKGLSLDVTLSRMYGEGRSAGFELTDTATGEPLFSMDIDVNRPAVLTKIYEVATLRFRGVAPVPMISDKIAAVSTDRIFRRIKDVVDLYYLSKVFPFNKEEILATMKNSGRELGNFYAFLHRAEELEHTYDKFRFSGEIKKVPFGEIYDTVKAYIHDILPE